MTRRLLQPLAFVLPLVFNPFGTLAFEPFKITLIRLAAIALVVSWALGGWQPAGQPGPKLPQASRPLSLAALLYVAATTLATLTSIQPTQSLLGSYDRLQGLLTLLALAVLGLGAASLPSAHAERLADWLLAGSVLVCMYALLQQFRLDPLPWLERTFGPHSTVGSSTALGGYLALLAPMTVARAVSAARILGSRSGSWRSLAAGRYVGLLLLAGLQISVVLVTGVRGALLGLTTGLATLTLLMLCRGRRNQRAGFLLGLFLAALVPAAAFALTALPLEPIRDASPHLERLAGGDPHDTAAIDRLLIWQASLETSAASGPRLLVGFGPEAQTLVLEARFPVELANRLPDLRFDRVHNEVLDQLLTGGSAGLAAYLGLFGTAFAVGWRGQRQPADAWLLAALLASLAAHLVEGAFAFGSASSLFLFWLVLGLLASLTASSPGARGAQQAASLQSWPAQPVSGAQAGKALPLPRRRWVLRAAALAAALCLLPVVLSPIVADLAYTRALAYQGGKDPVGRIVWMRRAAALAPDRDLYKVALGLALVGEVPRAASTRRRAVLLEEAESILRQAVTQSPAEPYNLYHLGQFLELRSEAEHLPALLDEAAALFDRAARLSPNRASFHDSAGLALHKLGRWEDALAWYRQAGELQGLGAERSARQGDSLLALGRLPEARANYGAALQLVPRSALAHAGLASLLHREGDLAGALVEARQAARFQFREWRYRETLSRLERESGNRQAALVEARAAARYAPPWESQRLRELVEEVRG